MSARRTERASRMGGLAKADKGASSRQDRCIILLNLTQCKAWQPAGMTDKPHPAAPPQPLQIASEGRLHHYEWQQRMMRVNLDCGSAAAATGETSTADDA